MPLSSKMVEAKPKKTKAKTKAKAKKTETKPQNTDLNDRQRDILKVLKRSPKTTAAAHALLVKKNNKITQQAVRSGLRTLENRGLVRARSKWSSTLKRDVILWELTREGRRAALFGKMK